MSPPESTDTTDTQSSGVPELESTFQKRYEEGFDIYDEEYLTWLRRHHPESIPPNLKSLTPKTADVSTSGTISSPPCTTSSPPCTTSSPPCTTSGKYIGMYISVMQENCMPVYHK